VPAATEPTNCSIEIADTVCSGQACMQLRRGDTLNFTAAIGPDSSGYPIPAVNNAMSHDHCRADGLHPVNAAD